MVIAGAGVAALEAALALKQLAADRVEVTLVAPKGEFVYRPVAVLEPFAQHPPRRLALSQFAEDTGAVFAQDAVRAVDPDARILYTEQGHEHPYDALLVAIGARPQAVSEGAIAMDFAQLGESLRGLIAQVDAGAVRSLGLVAPARTWPLPVYEVALLVRERARRAGRELAVTIVTEEPAPLAVFGGEVSRGVARVLDEAGIETVTAAPVESEKGSELGFDRVAAVPALAGPRVPGLPADADGFLVVGEQCRVEGVGGVYAAGDCTDFPVKFGGIAALQADAAASAIARLAGAAVEPEPFDGVVHGALQSGWAPQQLLYFSARIEAGRAVESRTSNSPTASPEAKIVARRLAPYLDGMWAAAPRWLATQLAWEPVLAEYADRAPAEPA